MQATTAMTGRQYGLDWLRIGAFALLILYHIGMFFVPWGWHVKAAVPVDWAVWPMMAVNPWRLMLLFVISGVLLVVAVWEWGSYHGGWRERFARRGSIPAR